MGLIDVLPFMGSRTILLPQFGEVKVKSPGEDRTLEAGLAAGGVRHERDLLNSRGSKLRVDVALKALLPERVSNERAQELLRQDVRSAREVVSPNVCRIFDLVVEDGQELVSMEYIDGTTLEAFRIEAQSLQRRRDPTQTAGAR